VAVGEEQIENAIGAIDGINDTFTTPSPYEASSLHVWKNGFLDILEHTEVNSTTFTADTVPLVGDFLVVRYIEASP
jgi:hypothetical protein